MKVSQAESTCFFIRSFPFREPFCDLSFLQFFYYSEVCVTLYIFLSEDIRRGCNNSKCFFIVQIEYQLEIKETLLLNIGIKYT